MLEYLATLARIAKAQSGTGVGKQRYLDEDFGQMGRWKINMKKLSQGDTLSLRHKLGTPVMRDRAVSQAMKIVIDEMVKGKSPTWALLKPDEKEFLEHIGQKSGLYQKKARFDSLAVKLSPKQLKDRIDDLMGSISAGNDNPMLVKELELKSKEAAFRGILSEEKIEILREVIASLKN